ncbi:hypothetical protein SAMN05444920_116226 [Nonomuraea solani]|uniref:Uncharacterized protein n=1 Tax=Nonomuraea solani TaxID=1144553 RepID=A0A1H6ETS8_9ACTN|nr:hypothetical protein [Nonomuraea solani]SEH00491.1 hypothetical protein SAMN05444920_116226 [Nonomuraea solani]
MTLNVTVASRSLSVQTSDFRLTRGDTGAIVSSSAQKQVVLHYTGWSGLLCYTGLASWGSHDTAKWLGRILEHLPGQRSMRDVVERVRDEGNIWLKTVPAEHRWHTFTLMAYEGPVPHLYAISSFQSLQGADLAAPREYFFISHARVRGIKHFVTGQSMHVEDDEVRNLKDEVARRRDPVIIREAAAELNRRVANKAGDVVSESCIASHMLPDGSGEAQVFGDLNDKFIPSMIIKGMNVAPYAPKALREAGESSRARLVGVTWAKNGGSAAMIMALRPLDKHSQNK